MIRQNKKKLQFIIGGALLLTIAVTACNNGETKEVKKDSITTTIVTPTTIDTMVKEIGKKAPGTDPQPK